MEFFTISIDFYQFVLGIMPVNSPHANYISTSRKSSRLSKIGTLG